MVKSLIKWVGGKTQIIDKLLDHFPKEINDYHEPFVGGGSVPFPPPPPHRINLKGKVYAYDINEELVSLYKNIQKDYIELYEYLKEELVGPLNNTLDKELFYYNIRTKYNNLSKLDKNGIIGSAIFIFLNKTCFRGLYRVGPNGYNVPYGNYKNPEIINKEHLETIHNLIKNVIFECCDYKNVLNKVKKDDFVYLDPPYVPEKKTSFVSYTLNGFNLEEHNILFNLIKNTKCKFVLSNSDQPLVRESLRSFTITKIMCKRAINSKNPGSKTTELIIKN